MHQQHDLVLPTAERLIAALHLDPKVPVYEVGPGMGALTLPILHRGVQVVAVEIDPARAAHLAKVAQTFIDSGQLRLLCCDGRRFIPDLTPPWRVIANPPFQHSATLLQTWLLESAPLPLPQAVDLVLQYQTALKLVGETDRWTRSSVLWRLAGRPQVVQRLQRQDVSPPARVDLAWWSWRLDEQAPDPQRLRRVAHLVELAFRGDHRVRQALSGVATGPILKRQGKANGWDPDGPARMVPPQAWLALADFLASIGKLP